MTKDEYKKNLAEIAENTYDLIHRYLKAERFLTEPHLREIGGSYLEVGGKCLRPALLTFCCQAVGGDAKLAAPAAAAVEMFHTWTLMHDDVIDHDDFRRGRPTAHVRGFGLGKNELALGDAAATEYGVDLAILGGDYLQGAAYDMMMSLECNPAIGLALGRRMCAQLNPELLAGEQLDVKLSITPWEKITEDDINIMMRGKTGALLAFCAMAGAVIGRQELPEKNEIGGHLSDFAHLCGLAFQMKDDLLGVFGEEAAFGKPIGSDIREGKRTVLMLRTRNAAKASQLAMLDKVLGKSDATQADVDAVRSIVVETGADKAVEKLSDMYIDKAMALLNSSVSESSARECLEFWALSMVARNK